MGHCFAVSFLVCVYWCLVLLFLNNQALHEALMRQEELLAYIDSQEEAKYRVSCSFSIPISNSYSKEPLLGKSWLASLETSTYSFVFVCLFMWWVQKKKFCWWGILSLSHIGGRTVSCSSEFLCAFSFEKYICDINAMFVIFIKEVCVLFPEHWDFLN